MAEAFQERPPGWIVPVWGLGRNAELVQQTGESFSGTSPAVTPPDTVKRSRGGPCFRAPGQHTTGRRFSGTGLGAAGEVPIRLHLQPTSKAR